MSSPIVMKEHKFNIVADGKKSGLSKNGFEQSSPIQVKITMTPIVSDIKVNGKQA